MKSSATPLSGLLILLLIFMQLSQALHAISHIEERFPHAATASEDFSAKKYSAIKFCDQCLIFASVATAVSHKMPIFSANYWGLVKTEFLYSLIVFQAGHYFQSRAPPSAIFS